MSKRHPGEVPGVEWPAPTPPAPPGSMITTPVGEPPKPVLGLDERAYRIGADALRPWQTGPYGDLALNRHRASAIVLSALARDGLAVVAAADLQAVLQPDEDSPKRFVEACDRLEAAMPNLAGERPAPGAPGSPLGTPRTPETRVPDVPQPPEPGQPLRNDHSGPIPELPDSQQLAAAGTTDLLWAEGWIDPPTPRGAALRDRLAALEKLVLDGAATGREIAEFTQLRASHRRWLATWEHARQALAAELGEPEADQALTALTRAGITLTRHTAKD